MKIQLIIATEDSSYAGHLAQELSQRHGDTFDVGICSTKERLDDMLANRHYDVALASPQMAQCECLKQTNLVLLLWDERERQTAGTEALGTVRKYQRISAIKGDVLGKYAEVAEQSFRPDAKRAHITAVWSPAGGAGKTTVALAYAARCVSRGKKTLYLDLETFSSVPAYFENKGKSISEAFERLGSNLELLLQSIRVQDAGSGVNYFCAPSNYDDMSVLTDADLKELILTAGSGMDEVVLDLDSVCDGRCRSILEQADSVFAVVDSSRRAQTKWEQFTTQHDTFLRLRSKTVLVCNMGAKLESAGLPTVCLPAVRADSPTSVYKNLSASDFGV